MSDLFLNRVAGRLAAPLAPVVTPAELPMTSRYNNPFMAAQYNQSPEFLSELGKNRPLAKPMFLGYRDNKALYGGSRLFVLY